MNLNNQLLIALPDMQDPRFNQAVILICEHNENGAMGLVVNHPIEDLDTTHVFIELGLGKPNDNVQVLDGGPLQKNSGFILHQDNSSFKSTIKIQKNLSLTTSQDLLKLIANHHYKNKWQFILGYSGWVENQLEEEEVAQNTWLTCPVNLDLIFSTPTEKKWAKALSLIGIHDYKNISDIAHA